MPIDVIDGNTVAPPQLTTDTPIMDVVQPVEPWEEGRRRRRRRRRRKRKRERGGGGCMGQSHGTAVKFHRQKT